jgi:hypothetical protein
MRIPNQSRPVMRQTTNVARVDSAVYAQGCPPLQWLGCAATVAGCVVACASGVASAGCIACMGGAYNNCKDCL